MIIKYFVSPLELSSSLSQNVPLDLNELEFLRFTYNDEGQIEKIESVPCINVDKDLWTPTFNKAPSWRYDLDEKCYLSAENNEPLASVCYISPDALKKIVSIYECICIYVKTLEKSFQIAKDLSAEAITKLSLGEILAIFPNPSDEALQPFLPNKFTYLISCLTPQFFEEKKLEIKAQVNILFSLNSSSVFSESQWINCWKEVRLLYFLLLQYHTTNPIPSNQFEVMTVRFIFSHLAHYQSLSPSLAPQLSLLRNKILDSINELNRKNLNDDERMVITNRLHLIQEYFLYQDKSAKLYSLLTNHLKTFSSEDIFAALQAETKYGDSCLLLILSSGQKRFLDALLTVFNIQEDNAFVNSAFLQHLLETKDEQNTSLAVSFFVLFPARLCSVLSLENNVLKEKIINECIQLTNYSRLLNSFTINYPQGLKTWLENLPNPNLTHSSHLKIFVEALHIAVQYNTESLNILLDFLKEQKLSVEQKLTILTRRGEWHCDTAFHFAMYSNNGSFLILWDFLKNQGATMKMLGEIFALKGGWEKTVLDLIYQVSATLLFHILKPIKDNSERNYIRENRSSLSLSISFMQSLEQEWRTSDCKRSRKQFEQFSVFDENRRVTRSMQKTRELENPFLQTSNNAPK